MRSASLALTDEALRDLRGETLQGELRLAVTDYFRPGDLARLLARLGESYPQVRLHVSILKSGEIEAGYARGEFDVGLSMRIAGQRRRRDGHHGSAGAAPRIAGLDGRGRPARRARRTAAAAGAARHLLAAPVHGAAAATAGVPYSVAHVASGVAGLQSALAAGLGVACLNESALCEGVARLAPPHGLPALPRVAFHFLPARRGETEFVARARELLASHLV